MTETRLQMQVLESASGREWDALVCGLPGAHFLQTWEWAMVKEPVGWQPHCLVWKAGGGPVEAAALVLERKLRIAGVLLPASVLYAPRAPLLNWEDRALRRQVLEDLQVYARRRHAIFLKIDPDVIEGWGLPGSTGEQASETGQEVKAILAEAGWHYSSDQIQFRNTVVVNLEGSEEEQLARMKQKTRYNIRLAEKKGVEVNPAGESDLPLLYQMYAETSVRDGFVIRGQDYYLRVWSLFMRCGLAEPLIARVGGEPVAGLIVMRTSGRAWYVYGMSRAAHREKMPNYLLQWEAMRRARAAGCREYDLWGAPDHFDESDPMWGVYRFKEGLGGEVKRTLGAWDYPVQPVYYRLYTRILPRLLDMMRRRGKNRTRQQVSAI